MEKENTGKFTKITNQKEGKLNTPVLYLIYNRLDTVKISFEEIRKARPKQLFIAGDGWKANDEDIEKVEKVRKYILDNIDWDCEVKTLFRICNLGCKDAITRAITWFFENVDKGIILEDDILPSQSFFKFCEEMLNAYEKHDKITHISGVSVKEKGNGYMENSYFFAKGTDIWGWATWANAWEDFILRRYDFENKREDYNKIIDENYPTLFSKIRMKRYLKRIASGKIDTWDYQWEFHNVVNHNISIIPKVNLVENIGFNDSGTHTKNCNFKLKREELEFPLKLPSNEVKIDDKYFEQTLKYFRKGWVGRKLKGMLK